jgi:cytidylate kinase
MAILTIAREYGSGGKEIGQAVAAAMGYEYVDRKKILADMKRVGLKWEEQAKMFDEVQPSSWDRHKWSFRAFVALNQYHILGYALKENVVIIGRGGNFLLKDIPFALRVRIEGPIEKRIENVMKWQEETNSEYARWLIEKADKDMAGAVYMIYGSQWNDPKQYDMVFNTGVKTNDEITDSIKNELIEKDQFKTEKAEKILELKTLAAKVKAEIAINPELFISSLDVMVKEEGLSQYGLTLRGVVNVYEDIKRIEELAKTLAGGVSIECKIHFRWQSRFK